MYPCLEQTDVLLSKENLHSVWFSIGTFNVLLQKGSYWLMVFCSFVLHKYFDDMFDLTYTCICCFELIFLPSWFWHCFLIKKTGTFNVTDWSVNKCQKQLARLHNYILYHLDLIRLTAVLDFICKWTCTLSFFPFLVIAINLLSDIYEKSRCQDYF